MNDAIVKATADKVATALEAAGVSQNQLSEQTGIPRITMRRRIEGLVPFDVVELARVAEVLGCAVADLLPDDALVPAAGRHKGQTA